ncbi:FixH family protein [Bacillus sp. JCM 19041]|uniref:FixH family protein n=1 Tax=Bacillus sp. JCM 19041 TaxID=1460637 RepID=UPI0006CFF3E0
MKWLLPAILAFVLLVGCSEEDGGNELSLEVIEVDIDVEVEQRLGESFDLQTWVTQGDDKVEDAHEVLFELWKDGDRDNAEFHEAIHEKDGLYRAPVEVSEDGIYLLQAHVTARDMHVMPTQEIIVGTVSEEKRKAFYDDRD